MEGTHSELRSWFTNGLGRNDSHGFTQVHGDTGGKGATVTSGTHTHERFTHEDRANDDLTNATGDELRNQHISDIGTSGGNHFALLVHGIRS